MVNQLRDSFELVLRDGKWVFVFRESDLVVPDFLRGRTFGVGVADGKCVGCRICNLRNNDLSQMYILIWVEKNWIVNKPRLSRTKNVPFVFPGSISCLFASARFISNHHLSTKSEDYSCDVTGWRGMIGEGNVRKKGWGWRGEQELQLTLQTLFSHLLLSSS